MTDCVEGRRRSFNLIEAHDEGQNRPILGGHVPHRLSAPGRVDPFAPRRDRRASRGDPPARMPHRRRIRPARVRDRRADGLPPAAARGRAAALDRGGRARHAALPRREGQCRAARRRDLALGRGDPAGGRGRHRADQDEPHPRGQSRRPLCAGRGRRDQSRDFGGGRSGGLLLRPRSVLAARLHHRRQHRR